MAFFKDRTFTEKALAQNEGGGQYINPSKLPDGEPLRFCILSEEPLTGYEVWFMKPDGKQTKRITPEEPDSELISEMEQKVGGDLVVYDNGRRAVKPFTAFFVYDYEAQAVRLFAASQKSLISVIERLTSDEDYEDLNQWDMKVTRTKTGSKPTDVEYSAMMVPTRRANEKVGKEVITAWDAACTAGYDLEALYEGGNPFGGTK